jgi:hypothetical protein
MSPTSYLLLYPALWVQRYKAFLLLSKHKSINLF